MQSIPAYMTIYIPSVSYIFPATAFTELELLQLDEILLPKLLPCEVFTECFAHTLVLALKCSKAAASTTSKLYILPCKQKQYYNILEQMIIWAE